jgi:ABC-2 type transport system ATP-binding protein
MSADPAVALAGLTKHYGRVPALRGVDLTVRRGEIFGFLGPNGAGKTTTIRCLLDLIRPSGGSVRVLGLNPQADPLGVRARCGYLPGELRLEESFSVGGALRYLGQLRGGRAAWSEIETLAGRLDLPLNLRIRNLSKGNKQKVGVVQALMHHPELLLLDEPTAGLDPLVQQEVLKLLREARAAGTTVFFSSHVLSEVQALAERVAIIRQGVVVEVAETAQLLQRSLRRVHLQFKQPVDPAPVLAVPGVTLLGRDDGAGLLLQVAGDMEGLIKALAPLPVGDIETAQPSLEEVFLAYYAAPAEAL